MARFVQLSVRGLGVSEEPVDVMINPEMVVWVRNAGSLNTQIDTATRTVYVRESVAEIVAKLS